MAVEIVVCQVLDICRSLCATIAGVPEAMEGEQAAMEETVRMESEHKRRMAMQQDVRAHV